MKVIYSIVLILVSTSLALASNPRDTPKVNMTKVEAQAAYMKGVKLKEIVSLCNKNLGGVKGGAAPTQSNIEALTNYFKTRKQLDIKMLEPGSMLGLAFASRENNGLYDYAHNKRILITDLLEFCDSAMHAAYEKIKAKTITQSSQGLIDATVNMDPHSKKEVLNAENGLFKANNNDGAWRLTNSFDRIATYEMKHESGPKMIVLIKRSGQEYQLDSELPAGYYQLHGSYPFDVLNQGHVEIKDILVFEQMGIE